MWNRRRTLSVFAVLAIIGLTATCSDEFPNALEEGADTRFRVTIEPVSWVDQLRIGEQATLQVQVVDNMGRTIPGVGVTWNIPSELSAPSGTDQSKQVTGTGLNEQVVVEVSIADVQRFQPTTYTDTVSVLLAGVQIQQPAADTTLTAFGDTTIIEARGLDMAGNPVNGVTLDWNSGALAALEPVEVQGELLRAASRATGTDEVVVSSALCMGQCADTVQVTVNQVVTAVAASVDRDTLLAGDAATASAGGSDRNGFDVSAAAFNWVSRDTAVADVSSVGGITGNGTGVTYVVASAPSGAADSVRVEVLPSGDMVVSVTDAPADYYANAWLYVAGAYVRDDLVAKGPRWLMTTPAAIDLLTLQGGLLDTLGIANVPLKNYSQVYIVLDSAAVQLKPGYAFADASTRAVMVPSPAPDTVTAVISSGANVTDGGMVDVVVEFDVNGTFPLASEPDTGSVVGDASFVATARSIEKSASGNVTGTVTNADTLTVGGRTIRVVRTDVLGDTLTARTATDGSFGVYYLDPGNYKLSVQSSFACYKANPVDQTVGVTAGAVTSGADFSLDLVVPDSVVITSPQDTVNALGDTVALTAAVYQGGTPVPGLQIGWSSVDAGLMSVDRNGRTIANAVGSAQIVAEVCGVADTAALTIRQVPSQLLVSPAPVAVDVADTVRITSEVADSNGVVIPGQAITYAIADTLVATVDSTGLVTGVSGGITTMTVTGGGLNRDVSVQVVIPGLLFDRLSIGGHSSCDINGSGAAYCWGDNGEGQLGDGTYDPTADPVAVSGGYVFASVDMAPDQGHACGVTITGEAYCWGRGWNGQLGAGSFSSSNVPVLVTGSHTWIQVETGNSFTCGITTDAEAYCWGVSWDGRLGNDNTTGSTGTPTLVAGGLNWEQLSLGDGHACGRATDLKTYCWGQGWNGQLGDDLNQSQPVPSQVLTAKTFTWITTGRWHSCGVDTDGNAYCWGQNDAGQLGNGNTNYQSRPVVVSGLLKYTTLDGGAYHTCGVLQDGRSACWGRNWDGRLGDGTYDEGFSPVIVTGGQTFTDIGAGQEHSCGMTAAGETYCWGQNWTGQLGNGVQARENAPVDVGAGFKVKVGGLGLGSWGHNCVIDTAGQPYCTGQNYGGQLGDGTQTSSAVWVAVQTAEVFTKVVTGSEHSCGITDAGDAYCWGIGWSGELGQSAFNSTITPILVAGGHTWADIAAGGSSQTCGVTTTGELYCWGGNWNGQAGQIDTNNNYNTPQLVDDVNTWVAVGAGSDFSCGITDVGDAYCWGYDSGGNGVFGDNTSYGFTTTPNLVSGGYVFTSLTVSQSHVCGITDTQAGYCWGYGQDGQIGQGNYWTEYEPTRAGAVFFTTMEAGDSHTCAITDAGDAACWGGNWNGQLGTGTFDNSASPVLVTAPDNLADIAAGQNMSCGVGVTDGTLYCWGNRGNDGLFGDGGKSLSTTPVATVGH